MITIKNLTVSVEHKPILKNINYTFEKGKVYAIMGPNGSGKSTLAYAIMGHPSYAVDPRSEIYFNNEPIHELEPDKRSELGIFLSFQQPLSLAGVKVSQLLQLALKGKKDPLAIRQEMQKLAKELLISEHLLTRSLNDGASGGEKKKMEVLQAAILDKSFLMFDEVDTGVDVDALKTIATFLNARRKDKTYIVITHYNRILQYLKPDRVLVLENGGISQEGDHSLASQIEEKGYRS